MLHVNIISQDNGAGLTRNIDILTSLLYSAGISVTVSRMSLNIRHKGIKNRIRRLSHYLTNRCHAIKHRVPAGRFDINIFIERIWPEWLPCARRNLFIPNQEWFRDKHRPLLPKIDLVICQTRHAQSIFSQLGCRTEYTSFTSIDRYDHDCAKSYSSALHVAGNSNQKGTGALVDAWSRHPEWPELCILHRRPGIRMARLPNVEYIDRRVSERELRYLQNSRGLHLCPSESEGFGHYIAEGMSAQSLTVVTDAPPMNEISSPDRSILVEYNACKPQRLGTNYYVDPEALEAKVGAALDMDESSKARMGTLAREWFIENDRFFRRRFIEVITGI